MTWAYIIMPLLEYILFAKVVDCVTEKKKIPVRFILSTQSSLLEVVSVLRFSYWKLDAGVWERISADG